MRKTTLWRMLAGVEGGVVEKVEYSLDGVVVHARPHSRNKLKCPQCGVRCAKYDSGEGRRQWRALDLGTTMCVVEGDADRVACPEHGVIVAWVPWARHQSRFTRAFEDQVAWQATQTSKTAVKHLMRVSWRTVGRIISRVVAEGEVLLDRFANVKRIGIDEISYRKGHKYLTVVIDHDTGRLLWAADGRKKDTLRKFFDELGDERSKAIELVSCDAASWIHSVVKERCPNATICLDPFHVVQWATEALDEVRKELWNEARRSDRRILAKLFKKVKYSLLKNPEKLTEGQDEKLSSIAKNSSPLYRAYLLKEVLREVFQVKGETGAALLDEFLAWASRSRLKPFVKLARRIRKHLAAIHAVLEYGLSNALIESTNTKIRLITRMAFGFHSPESLIALAMLRLGGLCPDLPGR